MFEESTNRVLHHSWSAFSTIERLLLIGGCAICAFVVVGIGRALDVPEIPKYAGSLLAGPAPILAVIGTAIAIGICTLIGAFLSAFLRLEAGLFCVTIGLAALSIRGGPMHAVLQTAAGPSVFLALAGEVVLLLAIVWGAWLLLRAIFPLIWSGRLGSRDELRHAAVAVDEEVHSEPADIAFAIVAQVLVMILLESLLLQSDAKKQALASVGISSCIATLAACQLAPLVRGTWYWLGPAIVGIIGYLMAYLAPQGWAVGETHGTFAALARAVPLDYASLGIAGAMLGYWTARKWKQESEQGGHAEDEAPATSP